MREENFTSKAVTFLARSKYSTVQVLKDALKDRILNDEVNDCGFVTNFSLLQSFKFIHEREAV